MRTSSPREKSTASSVSHSNSCGPILSVRIRIGSPPRYSLLTRTGTVTFFHNSLFPISSSLSPDLFKSLSTTISLPPVLTPPSDFPSILPFLTLLFSLRPDHRDTSTSELQYPLSGVFPPVHCSFTLPCIRILSTGHDRIVCHCGQLSSGPVIWRMAILHRNLSGRHLRPPRRLIFLWHEHCLQRRVSDGKRKMMNSLQGRAERRYARRHTDEHNQRADSNSVSWPDAGRAAKRPNFRMGLYTLGGLICDGFTWQL